MNDGSFNSPNPSCFGNMDYDFMDQLLDEGCWLQTVDGSNYLQSDDSGPFTSRSFSFPVYRLEGNSSCLNSAPSQSSSLQEERERWSSLAFSQESSKEELAEDSRNQDQKAVIPAGKSLNQTHGLSWKSDELDKLLWIAPRANSEPSATVKDRLMSAIFQLSELNRNRDVLIQIWVPVIKGLKSFLTTFDQPFFSQPSSSRLQCYRGVSERYEFLADKDTKQALGLPGRVFLGKAPEWTPDVRFFKQEEYPRIQFAHEYDVRGSIALPVFEKGSGDCLGVVEIIMTTDKFNYRPEVESVCRALETVHLSSSGTSNTFPEQVEKGTYEALRREILNVLRTVSNIHGLPIAQTWAPCSQQGKGGCWHSKQNALCVSILESACYVRDQRVLDFHKACLEHHLLRGRGGIVGKAFETTEACFATDVTEFSKVDYPLSHHAKMSGLRGAVAIRLQSIHHKLNDYVMEFYLPVDIEETGLSSHGRIWQTVSMLIQQTSEGLRFVTVKDFEQQTLFPSNQTTEAETKLEVSAMPRNRQETSFWFSNMTDPLRKGKEVVVSLDFGEEETSKDLNDTTHWLDSEPYLKLGQPDSDYGNMKQTSKSDGVFGTSSGGRFPLGCRKESKKRTKAQKTISLQVLRQYFAGSLKDAAKNIGVCPTTLKRICRQHGIARWPSRKIKKVGHSLQKLQLVIDSVHGAQGAIKLSSFYTNFPELSSSNNQSTPNQVCSLNLNDQANQQPTTQLEGGIFGSGATTSNSTSTSSSQTSTSNHCIPSGSKISPPVTTTAPGSIAFTADDPSGSLKRTRSEAELQVLNKKEHSRFLERSQSNRTHAEHPSFETLPALPVAKSWPSRDPGVFKAKVTFGEFKVRFNILPNMRFQNLQQDIGKRFNLADLSKISIKYLDDDMEWVLLTCDDDLEECIDIHRSSASHTIKLALSVLGSSIGSSGLS